MSKEKTQKEWEDFCDRLRAFIDKKEAENKKLKEFARWVMRSSWQGVIDDGNITDKGIEFGLLYETKLQKEDLDDLGGEYLGEYYDEEDIGVASIFHFTDILKEGD